MSPAPPHEGDVRVHPIPAVEPSPRFAARVAAGIFAGEALILPRWRSCRPLRMARRRARGDPRRVRRHRGLPLRWARAGPPALPPGAHRARHGARDAARLERRARARALRRDALRLARALRRLLLQPAPGGRAARASWPARTSPSCSPPPRSTRCAAGWLTLVGILFPAAGVLRAVRDGVTQLVNRLSEAALTDTLTGLRNRLALDRELHAEVERAHALGQAAERRDRRPRLLQVRERPARPPRRRRGARARRAGAPPAPPRGRLIARTGGEEFTILLPGATEHEAYLVSERMRTAVEHEFADDPAVLTFSFGVATFPDHGALRGRGARGGRPGALRRQGARAATAA